MNFVMKGRGVFIMTEKELEKIREYIIDNVMTNENVMFSNDRFNSVVDLPEIIASLYELLHQQVTGEPYHYFFHFANKIGAYVEDDLFSKRRVLICGEMKKTSLCSRSGRNLST